MFCVLGRSSSVAAHERQNSIRSNSRYNTPITTSPKAVVAKQQEPSSGKQFQQLVQSPASSNGGGPVITQPPVYKIVTVGGGGVGKSSMILQFMYDEVSKCTTLTLFDLERRVKRNDECNFIVPYHALQSNRPHKHAAMTIGLTDMTSLAVFGRLENASNYCTKVRKTGAATALGRLLVRSILPLPPIGGLLV